MAIREQEINRTQLIAGVAEYFRSDHWHNFLNFHLDNPDEEVWHSHIYLSTSIHPDSLVPIVEGFFAARDQGLVRCIDYLTPRCTISTPKDCPTLISSSVLTSMLLWNPCRLTKPNRAKMRSLGASRTWTNSMLNFRSKGLDHRQNCAKRFSGTGELSRQACLPWASS